MERKNIWEVRLGLAFLGVLLVTMLALGVHRWHQSTAHDLGSFHEVASASAGEHPIPLLPKSSANAADERDRDKLIEAMNAASKAPTLAANEAASRSNEKSSAASWQTSQPQTHTVQATFASDEPAVSSSANASGPSIVSVQPVASTPPSTLTPPIDARQIPPVKSDVAQSTARPQAYGSTATSNSPANTSQGSSVTSGSSASSVSIALSEDDGAVTPTSGAVASDGGYAPRYNPSAAQNSYTTAGANTPYGSSVAAPAAGDAAIGNSSVGDASAARVDRFPGGGGYGTNYAGSNGSSPQAGAQQNVAGGYSQSGQSDASRASGYGSAPSSAAPSYYGSNNGSSPVSSQPSNSSQGYSSSSAPGPGNGYGAAVNPYSPSAATPLAATSPVANDRGRRDVGTYEVQPNDTFWTISQKVYSNGAFYKALAEVNRIKVPQPDKLDPGLIVSTPPTAELRKNFPDLCPRAGRREAVHSHGATINSVAYNPNARVYVVQEGDTLSSIAHYELGKITRWSEIYELNRDAIGKEYNYLTPGMQLVLPARSAPAGDRLTRQPNDAAPYRR